MTLRFILKVGTMKRLPSTTLRRQQTQSHLWPNKAYRRGRPRVATLHDTVGVVDRLTGSKACKRPLNEVNE